ncbi:hypothetical protein B6N60_04380 [Richelia sinica FACHB-800]|uniref:Uncharacterized protein n=1 Tax=Richelia sinica FACHB-800 TaxID=1357546 RepID=A0A975TBG9_9NOST|nr:hypothetical protein B6N60_04380 [Richelia sinica FACHB-800]
MKHSAKLGSTLFNALCGVNTGAVSSFMPRLLLAMAWLGYEPAITYPGSNE